jgi:4-hydroxy-tetrahydrodipicolinate synthase
MITPFGEDDRIDFEALSGEARFLKASGVNGIVVGGSMGEGAGLSTAELAEAVRVTIAAVEASLPVLGAVIADSSAEAIRLGMAAKTAGACGLQVPPPHFGFVMELRTLSAYYRAIADATGLPLIIYNVVPWAQLAVDGVAEMAAGNPAIVGVKQSGRNMHALAGLLATLKGRIRIFSAIDDMIYPSLMLGVDGTISGTSTVFPREIVRMVRAVRDGDHATALDLHERITPVWRAIDYPDFPSRAKYAIRLAGRPTGMPRKPFGWPVGEAARSIEEALRHGGFLRDESTAQEGVASLCAELANSRLKP